jgi:glycosyltransferase involved in cell wall biosynthesis
VGLYSLANSYYQRYSLPMMLTETSIEGAPINREIWLETTLDDVRRLREEGVPMLGYIWWPLIDQLDWDGALTHRIGKIHQVGLFSLEKQADGTLARNASSLVSLFRQAVDAGTKRIGELSFLAIPTEDRNQNIPLPENDLPPRQKLPDLREIREERLAQSQSASTIEIREPEELDDGHFGIVVFSHLRWGFVWQRPQQLLSRFARNHSILFIEEPLFDLADCQDSYMLRHRVMPNVVVGCPHFPRSFVRNARLPETLRKYVREAMSDLNETGQFSQPLLWYYSPMDASWSLGQFENRGIVYDAMDELSQFSGASPRLVDWENRLMEHADIVLAGGHQLWQKKRQSHDNAHFFGCGVEYDHFARAQASTTSIPPDIDFMTRPILGWFGVIDERVDYAILPEIARLRPDWSIAMVGPVVKVDPNLLPHAPNLFWLGQRDYQVLPNYCRAFDVCIMPFAQTPATEFINPTKVLEYFATGRPVISTPVQDVIRQYDGLVYIARDAGEFVETIERILKTPDTARLQRAMDMARSSSWDAIVVTIRELIRQSISRPDRRSGRQLFLPMAEEDLDYSYVATQGS